jgi:TolB-like protein
MGNKFIFIFIFILIASLSFGQNRDIITVLDFKTSAISHEEMVVFVDYLIAQIVESGKFTVIDRTQRNTILMEQEFSVTDCVEESCQLNIGKMLAAKYIMVGSIGKFGDMYILNTKFINVETGETIKTSSEKYNSLNQMLDNSRQIIFALMDMDPIAKPVARTEKATINDKGKTKETAPSPAITYFTDEFDKPALDSRWYWEKEPGKWSLAQKPGYLSFQPENLYNVLLTNLELTDFQIDTKIELIPYTVYRSTGLRLYFSDKNIISLYLQYEWGAERIYFTRMQGKKWDQETAVYGRNPVHFRIIKKGAKVTGFYSKDGKKFYQIAEVEVAAEANLKAGPMGLVTSQEFSSGATAYANCDYFRVSKLVK